MVVMLGTTAWVFVFWPGRPGGGSDIEGGVSTERESRRWQCDGRNVGYGGKMLA